MKISNINKIIVATATIALTACNGGHTTNTQGNGTVNQVTSEQLTSQVLNSEESNINPRWHKVGTFIHSESAGNISYNVVGNATAFDFDNHGNLYLTSTIWGNTNTPRTLKLYKLESESFINIANVALIDGEVLGLQINKNNNQIYVVVNQNLRSNGYKNTVYHYEDGKLVPLNDLENLCNDNTSQSTLSFNPKNNEPFIACYTKYKLDNRDYRTMKLYNFANNNWSNIAESMGINASAGGIIPLAFDGYTPVSAYFTSGGNTLTGLHYLVAPGDSGIWFNYTTPTPNLNLSGDMRMNIIDGNPYLFIETRNNQIYLYEYILDSWKYLNVIRSSNNKRKNDVLFDGERMILPQINQIGRESGYYIYQVSFKNITKSGLLEDSSIEPFTYNPSYEHSTAFNINPVNHHIYMMTNYVKNTSDSNDEIYEYY